MVENEDVISDAEADAEIDDAEGHMEVDIHDDNESDTAVLKAEVERLRRELEQAKVAALLSQPCEEAVSSDTPPIDAMQPSYTPDAPPPATDTLDAARLVRLRTRLQVFQDAFIQRWGKVGAQTRLERCSKSKCTHKRHVL